MACTLIAIAARYTRGKRTGMKRVRWHACNSTRSTGQRNTWLELVIKCSRQFRKRVTVTVCNCRTLRGFQFGHAAPEDLHTLCFVCDANTISATGITKFGRESISLSFFRFLFLPRPPPPTPLLLSNVVINELRPFPWMGRYEFHRTRCSSLMDDAREICNIVPFPGFDSSVSSGGRA